MRTEFISVVYFDGVCNLCNFWVRVVKKIDRKSRLELRSLQSIEGQEFIKKYQLESGLVPDSVVYCKVITGVDLNSKFDEATHSVEGSQSDLGITSNAAAQSEALLKSITVPKLAAKNICHQVYFESDAILHILKDVGLRGKMVYWLLRLIPRFLRNTLYRWVAKNRYKWFGTCEL
jgi:predicted DCC family thiol-disulfide oxidoreductase YuxK